MPASPRRPGTPLTPDEQADTLGALPAVAAAPAVAAGPLAGPTIDGAQRLAGRYRIVRRLGAGGMGVVHEAHDELVDRRVALKTLRDFDAEALYRFKHEFRTVADLVHPHLIRLGELVADGGTWFFTMELVKGGSLLEHVRPGGQLDEGRLRVAFAEVLEGLRAVHQAGLVHRDVKPANVMVETSGRVVLLDFGLVSDALVRSQTEQGWVVGTPVYMAPEQAAQQPVGPPGDLYAVGVMLYEALTGQLPVSGSLLEILYKKQRLLPARPGSLAEGIPADLEALCMALLAIDPVARPSAQEVLAALGGTTSSGRRPAPADLEAPAFVGRRVELERLVAARVASRQGPVLVHVQGSSGTGKSALLARFRELCGPGTVWLGSRCFEREKLPHQAIDGVVDELSRLLVRLDAAEAGRRLPRDRDAAALVTLFPVLGRVPALSRLAQPGAPRVSPAEVMSRAVTALRELLGRSAERVPVVVHIDDVQWADPESLALLTEVLRPPDPPPVLVCCTSRPLRERPGLLAAAAVRLIELEGLGPAEVDELVRRLSPGQDAEQVRRLASESRGHPLYLQELIFDSQRRAEEADPAAEPRALDDVLRERAAAQAPEARLLVELVALSGQPLSVARLELASQVSSATVQRQLEVLRQERLVRTTAGHVESFHDRVREAVAASVEPGRRPELHGRLAGALEATGAATAEPAWLAAHLAGAGQAERAGEVAMAAARRAGQQSAFEQEGGLIQLALRLGAPSPAERRRWLEQLGDALASAGLGRAAAAAYLDVARSAPEAAVGDRCRHRAGASLLGAGKVEEGLAILRVELARCGVELPATWAGKVASLAWYQLRLRLRGLAFRPRRPADVELTTIDLMADVLPGLTQIDPMSTGHLAARLCLAALQAGEPRRVAVALGAQASMLLIAGQGEEGGRYLEALRRLEGDRSIEDPTLVPALVGVTEGLAAACRGDLREVRTALEGALAAGRRARDIAWYLDSFVYLLAWVYQQLGLLDTLARFHEAQLREARRREATFLVVVLSRNVPLLWLARDDPEAQAALIEAAPIAQLGGDPDGRPLVDWSDAMARAPVAFYRGDPGADEAEIGALLDRVCSSLLRFSVLTRGEMPALRAQWRLFTRPGERSMLEDVERTARRLEADAHPQHRVSGGLLRATLAHQRGRRAEALAHLRSAMAGAAASGHVLWEAAARRQLGLLTDGPAGRTLVDEADRAMTVAGVVRPDRMTRCLLPGWDPPA